MRKSGRNAPAASVRLANQAGPEAEAHHPEGAAHPGNPEHQLEVIEHGVPVDPAPLPENEQVVNPIDVPEDSLMKSLRGIPGVL